MILGSSGSLRPPSRTEPYTNIRDTTEYANPYGDYVKSWSSWTEDDYERVADYLKSGQGNTDYDFDWEIHAWIKTARYRSCLEGKSESVSPGELRNDLKDSLR